MAMDKKAFIAVLASLLLASIMGILSLHAAEANPYWGWVPGVVPAEPSRDKPILVIETPSNYSICDGGYVALNFTVIKPSSWNHTVQPFGDCANGHIKSVNVSLNGVEEFQDYLNGNNLNGGSDWNKSYSLSIGGVHLGTNSLSVTVSANAFYIDNNSTNKTVSIYTMNVTDTIILISGSSPTSSPAPIPTLTASLAESASALNFGNTVNFTVSVNGGKAPYIYTWNIEPSPDVTLEETTTSPYYSSNTFGPGSHHVYVEVRDADNNTAKTLTVEFNVLPLSSSQASPSSSISPVTTPAESLTPEPSQTPDRPKIGDFAPVIIPTSIILLAIVAMGLLIYFRKRRG